MLKCFAYVLKLISSLAATLFMGVVFLLYFPHWSCWFTLLFILIAVPIEKIQNFWKKLHIKGALKVIILILLFILALMNSPSGEDEASKPKPTESIAVTTDAMTEETVEPTIPETTVPEVTEAPTIPEATEAQTEPQTLPATETEETEPTQETEEEKLSIAQIAAIVEAVAKDSYNNCSVVYDDAGIMLNVWEDGVATGALLAYSGNKEMKDLWNDMSKDVGMMADGLTDFIRTSDQPHIYIAVNVLNDLDEESVILSYLNGMLVYDYVNDIDFIG